MNYLKKHNQKIDMVLKLSVKSENCYQKNIREKNSRKREMMIMKKLLSKDTKLTKNHPNQY